MTIFVKDSFRSNIEAASDGKTTVLYSQGGHPGFYCVIPKFNIEDIDPALGAGVHPAFIVNGVVKNYLYVAQFPATIDGNNVFVLPGRSPSVRTFDAAVAACAAMGAGFHLMTASEIAAIALYCYKNGYLPRGNTDYGRAKQASWENGRRADRRSPGNTSVATTASAFVLAGSGPVSWRHNNDTTGIADLVGNFHEWAAGARLNDGEIQIFADNDAANPVGGHGAGSSNWRAVNSVDGTLMAPGLAGSLKFDCDVAGTAAVRIGNPVLSDTIVNRNGTVGSNVHGQGYASRALKNVAASGVTVPPIVRRLALWEPADNASIGGDLLQVRNYGERMMAFGGAYSWGEQAGIFSRTFMYARTASMLFRPVYNG